jgi:DNA-binding beta-propeller fold protein YncE
MRTPAAEMARPGGFLVRAETMLVVAASYLLVMRARFVVVVACALGAAACGGSVAHVEASNPSTTRLPTRAVRSLLDGQHLAAISSETNIAGLVTDAHGDAWFFAGSRQDGRLYRYRSTDGLQSWVLGTTDNDRWGGLPPSVATDDDGTAYVALNDTLAHLNPATGVFAKIHVPVGLIDPIADSYGPPEIRSSDPIMAIASDGADHVAIIRRVSSIVQIYDHAQHRFSSVPVPTGYQAISVGYLGQSLVVGLYNRHAERPNTLAVYTTESIQPHLVTVRDSQRETPTVDRRLLVGTQIPALLSPDLHVAQIPIPRSITLDAGLGESPAGTSAIVADSVRDNAVVVIDDHTGKTLARYPVPIDTNCMPSFPAPGPGSTLPRGPFRCPITPEAITATPSQGLALEPTQTTISLIAIPIP